MENAENRKKEQIKFSKRAYGRRLMGEPVETSAQGLTRIKF